MTRIDERAKLPTPSSADAMSDADQHLDVDLPRSASELSLGVTTTQPTNGPTREPRAPSTGLGLDKPAAAGVTLRAPLRTSYPELTANAELFVTSAEVIDAVGAKLERALPDAVPETLKRLTTLGLEYAATSVARLATHELGHVHAARAAGADAHVDHIGFSEGLTVLEGPYTNAQWMSFAFGGLNQSESNLQLLHRESAQRGSLSLGHAMATLTSALDDTLYIIETREQAKHGKTWQYADPANIQRAFAEFGIRVTYEHMLKKALVADLASALNWDAVGTAVGYARNGERTRERTHVDIGGVQLTGPDVSLLRSAYGDTFRINAFAKTDTNSAWDVRLDVRTDPDDWDINAVGARLTKIDALRLANAKLTVSPYVGVSTRVAQTTVRGEKRTVGDFGFEVEAKLSDRLRLVGDVGVGKSFDGSLTRENRVHLGLQYALR